MPSASAALTASTPKRVDRRYGGLSAEQRSEQRRRKFEEAAIQVFGTLGLRKATIRDICNEARIAERYFSEHFANAAAAYEAAYKEISAQALAATGQAMAKAPFNTRDLAHAGLTAFMRFVQEDPRRAQIMLIDASSYWRHVTLRTSSELGRHAQVMNRLCAQIYPDLPPHIELEVIGAALIGASLQSCLTWAQNGFKQPLEVVVQHLMFAWEGLDRWFKSEIEAARSQASLAGNGDEAMPSP